MNKRQQTDAVVVYTGHAWEAEMFVNILENEGIRGFINNEVVGTLFPFYTTPGMGAVRVIVSESDAERARTLAEDFERGRFE